MLAMVGVGGFRPISRLLRTAGAAAHHHQREPPWCPRHRPRL